jgi:hypothetical protein
VCDFEQPFKCGNTDVKTVMRLKLVKKTKN